ncbi:PatB family C-S lyase [Treponema pedis]|uniref:cystalysin n=1 Tax=Treponema pedis TaxID=409322 RepID=UPI00056E14C8
MMYDFTTKISRKNTGSLKWDLMYSVNSDIGDEIVPLSVADMEFKNPPELIAGLKKALDETVLGYTGPTEEYKKTVKNWMRERHNWEIETDWIVPVSGVVPALYNAVREFTKPGEGVIIITPVYYPFFKAVNLQNRKIAECGLSEKNGNYTIDFDKLENLSKDKNNKALLFCSPHNPVGRVWKKEELQRVKDIILNSDLLLFSDEIHFDLIMPGYKHTVFQSLDTRLADRTVTFTAPSKTFNIAGMGISNIIIKNPDMRERFIKARDISSGMPTTPLGYKACEICYKECAKWLDECIKIIDKNQRNVKEFFEKEYPEIKAPLIEGTYLQWLDFRALKMDYKDLENFMIYKAQVFFDEGYIFGDGGKGFERINLAAPSSVISESLERLIGALKK